MKIEHDGVGRNQAVRVSFGRFRRCDMRNRKPTFIFYFLPFLLPLFSLAAPTSTEHFTLAPGVHMAADYPGGRLRLKLWTDEGTKPCEVALPFRFVSARDSAGSPVEPALRQNAGAVFRTYCFFVDCEKMAADYVSNRASSFRVSSSPIFLETGGRATIETNAPIKVMSLPGFACTSSFWAVGEYSKAMARTEVMDTPQPVPGTADGTYAAFVFNMERHCFVLQPYLLVSPVTIESVDVVWPANSPTPMTEASLHFDKGDKPIEVEIGIERHELQKVQLQPGEKLTLTFPFDDVSGAEGALFVKMPDGNTSTRTFAKTAVPIFPRNGKVPDRARSAVHASCWKNFGGITYSSDGAGGVWLEHDDAGLDLEVSVNDFEHFQTKVLEDPSRMWEQDSVQLGIDMDPLKPWEAGFAGTKTSQTLGGHRVFEFTFGADGNGGGKAYLERSWDDSLPAGTVRDTIKVETDRLPSGIPWRYRVFIPWAELGSAWNKPKPGDVIGIAIAVNDVDHEAPRRGWTLFGGIVEDIDPKLFGRAWLR